MRHVVRQRRPAEQQLHRVAGRHRRIERDREGRAGDGGDVVGSRGAGVRRRNQVRRAAGRRRGVERDRQRRGGRAVARRIGELRRNRLAAVRPEIARRHRQAHAAGRDVGGSNGVGHVVRQRRPAEQQLDRVAGRHRRIERDREGRAGDGGDVVGSRGAGVRRRNQVRRAAGRRHGVNRGPCEPDAVTEMASKFQCDGSCRPLISSCDVPAVPTTSNVYCV